MSKTCYYRDDLWPAKSYIIEGFHFTQLESQIDFLDTEVQITMINI